MTCLKYTSMVLVGLLALAGCGRSGQLPVAGKVSVSGKPVDRGVVTFQPAQSTDSVEGARIENGKFAFEADQGLAPGTYSVSITAMRLTGKKVEDRLSPTPVDELVAMKVRDPSLRVTISADNSKSLVIDFPAAKQ